MYPTGDTAYTVLPARAELRRFAIALGVGCIPRMSEIIVTRDTAKARLANARRMARDAMRQTDNSALCDHLVAEPLLAVEG
jgi:hypothetical protein